MKGHKREKQRQLFLKSGLNQQNSEAGKLVSKAKSLILRNIPEPLYYGLVKLRMPKSIDDLITSTSITGRSIPDFENLDFKIASGFREILTGNLKKQDTTAEDKAQ